MSEKRPPTTTTDSGIPVSSDEHSLTVGPNGPTVLHDAHLVQKMQHFNRERVPERVVHAKGSGAHGFFEVTEDVTQWTNAAFLSEVGKRTPMFARFSTVAGEMGSADTVRDPRGEKHFAGLVIGGALGLAVMVFGPATGAGLNPARWLGPALASGSYPDFWIYIVGPVIGALLAAVGYRALVLER